MSNPKKIFIYQDAKGNITAREISDISETELYIQGYCHVANGLRTFRKDRVLEFICGDDNVDLKLDYHRSVNPTLKSSKSSQQKLGVCFTGFKSEDKNRLKEMAVYSGMVVRSSVTKNLDFICCGYNAGPKKIEKARKQNVIALSEDDFIQLLETGEIPDS